MSHDERERFFSREASWLEFNSRVLRQSEQPNNPLLERMKYLSIVGSNLEEYFMIRVGSIHMQVRSGVNKTDRTGFTPLEQLDIISKKTARLYKETERIYGGILGELSAMGLTIVSADEVTPYQVEFCKRYFLDNIYPVVAPIVVDKGRAFPFIPGRTINIAVLLADNSGKTVFGTVGIPTSSERLIELPPDDEASPDGMRHFLPIEQLVKLRLRRLFPGKTIIASCIYRLTRNGDIDIDETGDLLNAVKKSLIKRRRGDVVRLEIEGKTDRRLISILQKKHEIDEKSTYHLKLPIGQCMPREAVKEMDRQGGLSYIPFNPTTPAILNTDESIFDVIKRGDLLLYHPYDCFAPVVRLVDEAASDPAVVAIKMTLYRLSENSPIVEALVKAAKSGKQVIAFVEARARFDEQNNIEYGAELQRAGVSVIYGLPKYKTHSKITLILRREDGYMRKYMHLGTGNYNDATACQYTDYSLLTANSGLGSDAVEFFRTITGDMTEPDLEYLVMAPFELRKQFKKELKRERKKAKNCGKASVTIKVNSLTDSEMIDELYKCSKAGVRIRLLVRGICCLRPGVEGLSENIEVRSIVGRFLEHSRVYCFGEDDDRRVYLSSADWMSRNLDRRVELMFPLLDRAVTQKVCDHLELYWSDNVRAMKLGSDGKYRPVSADDAPAVDAQDTLLRL